MMAQKRTILLVALAIWTTINAQDVGDSCTIRETGARASCQRVTQCASADDDFRRGVRPTVCGFYALTEPIVCCKDAPPEANDNLLPAFTPSSESPPSTPSLRISEQKCEEYSKPVTSVVQVLPLVSGVQPIQIKIPKCDYNSVPLIVGGEPASPGEFPFMAAVGFNSSDTFRCGGTLISDHFILTAAHCTFTRDAGQPSIVRLGELDMSKDTESAHKDYEIAEVIIHPEYSYPRKYNDIALLKTKRKIEFTDFIRPACLNTRNSINSDQGVATGWGKVDFAGDPSEKLMKVTINILNNDRCKTTFPVSNKELPRGVDKTMLCAGDLAGGRDTCFGDSGGPLVVTKRGNMCQFYLVGVTSFGKLCGLRNTPAIYTRVSEYIDWIEKTIW